MPHYAAAQPAKSALNKESKTQQYLKGQRKNARAMATVGQRRDGDDDDDDDDDEGIKFKIPYLSTQDIKPGKGNQLFVDLLIYCLIDSVAYND